jgi:hypothetical protein
MLLLQKRLAGTPLNDAEQQVLQLWNAQAAIAASLSGIVRDADELTIEGLVALLTRDDHTLILADTASFTSSHAALLQTVFPHVSFSVLSSEGSASGFIVVFACDRQGDRAWQRSGMRLLLHVACLLACVWTTAS